MRIYIFDLDNTLYPVNSISNDVGLPIKHTLINLNKVENKYTDVEIEKIYTDCWNYDLSELGSKYNLSLTWIDVLSKTYEKLEVTHSLSLYDDAHIISQLKGDKYLVTSGYKNLQNSKIEKLNIKKYFNDIFIDTPTNIPRLDKKFYFQTIFCKYNIPVDNFIVIGDNLYSEIQYANELNMISVYLNKNNVKSNSDIIPKYSIKTLYDLGKINI